MTSPTLLTGATGFVGAAVARALIARGHAVRALVRPGAMLDNIDGLPIERVHGDLRDHASLRAAVRGCATVVHVAADYRLWVPDPASLRAVNVDGTVALLTAAQEAGVARMVYCSSVAALGHEPDGSPASETSPVGTVIGHYKQSKYAAEQAVLGLIAKRGLPCVIVNPSTPIGPRDIKPTPTGRMIADAAAGRMPAYVATGLNIVHVDDVAEGHVLALERGRIGERYILGGTDHAMAEILAMVNEIVGRRSRPVRLTVPMLWPLAIGAEFAARLFGIEPLVTRDHLRMARHTMFFSSAKAQAELGYTYRPACQAIADAISWFAAHGRLARPRAS
jgi:dihydroflavonol-4-reductase